MADAPRTVGEILRDDKETVAMVKKKLHLRTDLEAAHAIERWIG